MTMSGLQEGRIEKIISSGFLMGLHTREELLNSARPAVFAALDDRKKPEFMRMARREQEIFIEAVLGDLGIKIPKSI